MQNETHRLGSDHYCQCSPARDHEEGRDLWLNQVGLISTFYTRETTPWMSLIEGVKKGFSQDLGLQVGLSDFKKGSMNQLDWVLSEIKQAYEQHLNNFYLESRKSRVLQNCIQ